MKQILWLAVALLLTGGCTPKPLLEYSAEATPMVMVPIARAGIEDRRARFREIYCAINNERGLSLPDFRDCNEVLVHLKGESAPTGEPVNLGPARSPLRFLFVPGFGWNCFKNFLDPKLTVPEHLAQFGHSFEHVNVDALSGTTRNARMIRDALMAQNMPDGQRNIILIGYSKGTPDILEAIVTYPELGDRVAGVVSLAGSVGGSPLANDASQAQANLLMKFPGSDCTPGDGGAVESLRTSVRREWLATHALPGNIRYYSLVTYPEPEQISYILESGYKKLSQIDPRNDSQMIFYDQIIPDSIIMAFINADHWAVAVPIDRSSELIASTLLSRNDFPREVLMEAIARFVEEDMDTQPEAPLPTDQGGGMAGAD